MHGVFRFEFPPLIEDCMQEEGRIERRVREEHETNYHAAHVLRCALTSKIFNLIRSLFLPINMHV